MRSSAILANLTIKCRYIWTKFKKFIQLYNRSIMSDTSSTTDAAAQAQRTAQFHQQRDVLTSQMTQALDKLTELQLLLTELQGISISENGIYIESAPGLSNKGISPGHAFNETLSDNRSIDSLVAGVSRTLTATKDQIRTELSSMKTRLNDVQTKFELLAMSKNNVQAEVEQKIATLTGKVHSLKTEVMMLSKDYYANGG